MVSVEPKKIDGAKNYEVKIDPGGGVEEDGWF